MPHSPPVTVLVADDTATIRDCVRRLLAPYGKRLEVIGEATDGVSAVVMTLTLKPDVVVMDVEMPALNGVEATRRIKRAVPGTKVIGFSIHHDPLIGRAMTDAGADTFLAKEQAGDLPEVIEQVAKSAPPLR